MTQKAPLKRGLTGLKMEGLMEQKRKTVLKLTLLDLCDILTNDQIESIIALAEDLSDAPHTYKLGEVHSL